jgi:hypothetical protein
MTVGNDQIFENLVNNFAGVEADENKNVDEQKKPEPKEMRVLLSWVGVDSESELRQRLEEEYQEDKKAAGVSFDEYFDKWYEDYAQALGDMGKSEYVIARDELEPYIHSLAFESVDENKNVDEQDVDEKKKPPMCKKCNKKHWPFQKCSAKESTVEEDAEEMGNVWKLESPEEDEALGYLSAFAEAALEGNRESQEFLERIFGEEWESIKEKLETEGSAYYVWWMDGVHEVMKRQKGKTKEGKSPVKGMKKLSDREKLDIALELLDNEQLKDFEGECRNQEMAEPPKLGMKPLPKEENKTAEGKSPQQGDKEATQIKKLSEEEDKTIVDEGFKTDLKSKDKKAIQQKIGAITDKLLAGEKLTRSESDYWDVYHAEVSKITGK